MKWPCSTNRWAVGPISKKICFQPRWIDLSSTPPRTFAAATSSSPKPKTAGSVSPEPRELNTLACETLQIFNQVNLQLERDFPPLLLHPVQDMRDQLKKLIPKNFLSATPPDWLQHLPRYVKAIDIRYKKLMNAGLPRDNEIAGMIRPLSAAYTQHRTAHAARGLLDPELTKLWWMIQELRISLFAQELKTAFPISVQRVEKQLTLVQP